MKFHSLRYLGIWILIGMGMIGWTLQAHAIESTSEVISNVYSATFIKHLKNHSYNIRVSVDAISGELPSSVPGTVPGSDPEQWLQWLLTLLGNLNSAATSVVGAVPPVTSASQGITSFINGTLPDTLTAVQSASKAIVEKGPELADAIKEGADALEKVKAFLLSHQDSIPKFADSAQKVGAAADSMNQMLPYIQGGALVIGSLLAAHLTLSVAAKIFAYYPSARYAGGVVGNAFWSGAVAGANGLSSAVVWVRGRTVRVGRVSSIPGAQRYKSRMSGDGEVDVELGHPFFDPNALNAIDTRTVPVTTPQ